LRTNEINDLTVFAQPASYTCEWLLCKSAPLPFDDRLCGEVLTVQVGRIVFDHFQALPGDGGDFRDRALCFKQEIRRRLAQLVRGTDLSRFQYTHLALPNCLEPFSTFARRDPDRILLKNQWERRADHDAAVLKNCFPVFVRTT
jgi:hypothetical protein